MVTLEQLSFSNALTYRECRIPLERQGFVFLRGANGAGKSTPWEILQHLLYGTTSRGLKKNGIVSVVPRDDGYVGELTLRNDQGRWLIRQSRGHSRHGTAVQVLREVDGQWSTTWDGGGCPKRADDAQRFAGQLVGLRQHEFSGCLYLDQAGAHTLIEGKPGEKQQYIAHLFGCDVYDEVVRILRERLKAAEQDARDVSALDQRLATLQEERDQRGHDAGPQLQWWAAQYREAERRAERAVAQQLDVVQRGDTARRTMDRRAQLEQQIAELAAPSSAPNPEALQRQLDDRRRLIDAVQRRHEAEQEVAGLPPDPDVDVEALAQRRQQLSETVAALSRRREIEIALQRHDDNPSLEPRLHKIVEASTLTTHDIERLDAERQEIERNLRTFASGECPTCRRPMTLDDMRRRLDAIVESRQRLEGLNEMRREKIEALRPLVEQQQRYAALTRELDTLPSGDVGAAHKALEASEHQLRQHQRDAERAARRRALEREIAELPVGDVEELSAAALQLQQQLRRAREQQRVMDEAAVLGRQLDELPWWDLPDVQAASGLARVILREYEALLPDIRERRVIIERDAQDVERLDHQIQEVSREIHHYQEALRAVTVLRASIECAQKLRRRRLHEIVVGIRDVLPRYAGIMFSHEPNTMFCVDEDDEAIDLVCRRVVNGAAAMVPVKGLSSGEKQRLNVALTFTLHSLLDPRKRPDCLVLDEVDRGLDEAGVASLMALVREVRDQYGTVVMTSHRAQITGAKFDAVWTVTKVNEVSELNVRDRAP